MPAPLVIGCLSEVHEALCERHSGDADRAYPILNMVDVYSVDCLKVARRFVETGVEAEYFHRVPNRGLGSSFACGTIGRYGDRGDIDLLRGLSRGHAFARHALAAIKLLDTVAVQGC
jgi:hypothetical protein